MRTLIFYLVLTIFTFIGTQIIDSTTNKYKSKKFIIVSFILWIFYALSNSGTDYSQYQYFYNSFKYADVFYSNQEVGYIVLNCLLKMVIKNPVYGLAAIKTMTFCLSFFALFRLKDKIEIGTAIFIWFCLQYFNGYLIAMSLASALVLLGTSYILDDKKILSLVFYVMAFTIHYSAIVILFFCVAYLLIGNHKFSRVMKVGYLLLLFFITAMLPQVIRISMLYIPALRKYSMYTETFGNSFGPVQFIFYLPAWLSLFYLHRNGIKNSFAKVFGVFVWQGFSIAMMGYILGILDRMFVYFLANFVLLVPYCLKDSTINVIRDKKSTFLLMGAKALLYLYATARLVLFIYEHYTISGLNNYTLLWQ